MIFTADVKNQGTSRANNIRIAYYVNALSSGYYDIAEIAAGDTVKVNFPWTAEAGSSFPGRLESNSCGLAMPRSAMASSRTYRYLLSVLSVISELNP